VSARPSYSLASLPAALVPSAWRRSAACRFEDRDLFFPPEEEHGGYVTFREVAAKRICGGCPVVRECLDYALHADERYGVWGGLSAGERERLRRGRRARGA
jgi:WhiB family redox-sensing transcriptional regulator